MWGQPPSAVRPSAARRVSATQPVGGFQVKDIVAVLVAILLRILVVAPFMLLFWWLRRSARNSQPREEGGTLVFALNPRMHVLIEIVILALVAFTGLVLLETIRNGEGAYAVLIPLVVLAAILLAEPKPVSIDQDGVHLHRWFRRDRVIEWHDVAWLRRGKNTGATYVKSRRGGRPISFSPLLNGQARFESEVKKHTCALDLQE